MPQILFLPEKKSCEAEAGLSLQDAAERAGVTLSFPCAGKGVCGKCVVKVENGSVEFSDNGKLSDSFKKQGFVLACRSKVREDAVILKSSLGDEQGQFADVLSHMSVNGDLFPSPDDIKPLISAVTFTAAPPVQGDGLGDRDRFLNAAREIFEDKPVELPLGVLRRLPDTLRERDGEVSVWHMEKYGAVRIVDVEPGGSDKNLGLAIDIGTTTVAIQLVDIYAARAIDTITLYNAQIDRGSDVISRISYAKNPERIEEMRSLVLSTINEGISELRARNGRISARSLRNAAISGNTTMTQMFLGINPNYIRLEPYTPAVMSVPLYTAGELGIEMNPCAYVWVAPNVGSYVGGDITAGLLCTDFASGTDDVCLFIDIGTNGEIVLGNDDFLMGCACSAGPAFEGGGIERGMRASAGAIESVVVDPAAGKCEYFVIGGGEPRGICGSGLISLLSRMFEAGIIDPRGKMDKSGKFESVQALRKNSRFYITERREGMTAVYVTENDIDNFIRAKAAIFSACLVMLKNVGLTFDDVAKFYIAGGFGRYIEIERAQTLGLLPPLDREKFIYIGNSSLTGSFMSLLSERHRRKKAELANRITYVDLSVEAGYMDEYVAAMFIPHTDAAMFQRRAVSNAVGD
ncbi:MAG: ASKHA domain-containing protein [Synergistaceae bacterium]|jgi:uncharacterized 2Fe-2S/4Fe-4S cluster protein (DUF4445 family)|nr:ASKHA domain-containing protein [Synergistaceae bacterium]